MQIPDSLSLSRTSLWFHRLWFVVLLRLDVHENEYWSDWAPVIVCSCSKDSAPWRSSYLAHHQIRHVFISCYLLFIYWHADDNISKTPDQIFTDLGGASQVKQQESWFFVLLILANIVIRVFGWSTSKPLILCRLIENIGRTCDWMLVEARKGLVALRSLPIMLRHICSTFLCSKVMIRSNHYSGERGLANS